MKNLYKVTNKAGKTLCFQVAKTEQEAVSAARNYYGHRTAARAEFVREN